MGIFEARQINVEKNKQMISLLLFPLSQVMESVSDAGITPTDVAMETVASPVDEDLDPPAPPKKRLVETNADILQR